MAKTKFIPLTYNAANDSVSITTGEYSLTSEGTTIFKDIASLDITKLLVPDKYALSGLQETGSPLVIFDPEFVDSWNFNNDSAAPDPLHYNEIIWNFGRVRSLRNYILYFAYRRGAAPDVLNFNVSISEDGVNYTTISTNTYPEALAFVETGIVTGAIKFQYMKWNFETKGLATFEFYAVKCFP